MPSKSAPATARRWCEKMSGKHVAGVTCEVCPQLTAMLRADRARCVRVYRDRRHEHDGIANPKIVNGNCLECIDMECRLRGVYSD